jgi:hypothetical protein
MLFSRKNGDISAQWQADGENSYEARMRKHMRRGATYPPPFPNGNVDPCYYNTLSRNIGWFKIMDCADLKRGEMKQISAFGQEMIAFRSDDEEGKISVIDAYCPHLGANLAEGGVVKVLFPMTYFLILALGAMLVFVAFVFFILHSILSGRLR